MRDLKNPLSVSIFDKTPEERQAAKKKRVKARVEIKAIKNEAKNTRRVDTSKSKATADKNLTTKKDNRSERTQKVVKAFRTSTKNKKEVKYKR
tara:strand:- start:43 stop:321 length:279 start_codon:yes stop_codon:yes gene_type:complete